MSTLALYKLAQHRVAQLHHEARQHHEARRHRPTEPRARDHTRSWSSPAYWGARRG